MAQLGLKLYVELLQSSGYFHYMALLPKNPHTSKGQEDRRQESNQERIWIGSLELLDFTGCISFLRQTGWLRTTGMYFSHSSRDLESEIKVSVRQCSLGSRGDSFLDSSKFW